MKIWIVLPALQQRFALAVVVLVCAGGNLSGCASLLPKPVAAPTPGYRLTATGKKKAGQLFAESFSDFQKASHGECDTGCCDGDDHSKCGDECALH